MKNCGWICITAGAWLLAAPFILGYSANAAALWNDVILGLVVLGAGAYMCFPKKSN